MFDLAWAVLVALGVFALGMVFDLAERKRAAVQFERLRIQPGRFEPVVEPLGTVGILFGAVAVGLLVGLLVPILGGGL